MATISNTGKTITMALTHEERATLEQRAGDDWHWLIPEFNIDPDGIGVFTFRANMFEGRKLGPMQPSQRMILVVPSHIMPMVPYFKRVTVDMLFDDPDPKVAVIRLPRELPSLSEKQIQAAKLAAPPKARVRVRVRNKPPIAAETPPTVAPIVMPPQANITVMIEGRSFEYSVPLEQRLRMLGDLSTFALV
jgi:hypothetical protein